MCLSLPGRVERLEGPRALVETAGVKRWCNALMHPNLQIGDRVLIHAGLILEVVTAEHASEIEKAFVELDSLTEPELATSRTDQGD